MDMDDLKPNRTDALVVLGKSVLGIVAPVVGPVLGEVIGALIPKQREDRIVEFLLALDEKISDHLTKEDFKQLCESEDVVDLIEDSLFHVARAISPKRREYISHLLSQGLSQEQLDHATAKKMLRLLDQLTDEELIYLKFYSLDPSMHSCEPDDADLYYEKHRTTLEPALDKIGNRSVFRASLQESYRSNLITLGLISIDKELTPLGDLFLQYIDDNHKPFVSAFDED
jgi:hypothetical protein